MKQNLQFYRSKTTKIRGQTFNEKLNTIVERCKKVYNDCETAFNEGRDLTIYRQEFGKEHKICFDLIDAVIPTEKDFLKASEDIEKFDLNYKFNSINDLYLDDEDKESFGYFID